MKYVLNLADDGRVLSVGEQLYIPENATVVESFPDGDLYEYRYINGEFVHDALPVEIIVEKPSQLDIIEAQVTYTAIMTNTLLEA
jgi:hypothetical protein